MNTEKMLLNRIFGKYGVPDDDVAALYVEVKAMELRDLFVYTGPLVLERARFNLHQWQERELLEGVYRSFIYPNGVSRGDVTVYNELPALYIVRVR